MLLLVCVCFPSSSPCLTCAFLPSKARFLLYVLLYFRSVTYLFFSRQEEARSIERYSGQLFFLVVNTVPRSRGAIIDRFRAIQERGPFLCAKSVAPLAVPFAAIP